MSAPWHNKCHIFQKEINRVATFESVPLQRNAKSEPSSFRCNGAKASQISDWIFIRMVDPSFIWFFLRLIITNLNPANVFIYFFFFQLGSAGTPLDFNYYKNAYLQLGKKDNNLKMPGKNLSDRSISSYKGCLLVWFWLPSLLFRKFQHVLWSYWFLPVLLLLSTSIIHHSGARAELQFFGLFRRTHRFWSISILSPALNKVSAKYTYGHFC